MSVTVSAAVAVSTAAAVATIVAAAAAAASEFVTEQSTGAAATQFAEEEGLRASDQGEQAQKGLKNRPHNRCTLVNHMRIVSLSAFFRSRFGRSADVRGEKINQSRNSARGFTRFCSQQIQKFDQFFPSLFSLLRIKLEQMIWLSYLHLYYLFSWTKHTRMIADWFDSPFICETARTSVSPDQAKSYAFACECVWNVSSALNNLWMNKLIFTVRIATKLELAMPLKRRPSFGQNAINTARLRVIPPNIRHIFDKAHVCVRVWFHNRFIIYGWHPHGF